MSEEIREIPINVPEGCDENLYKCEGVWQRKGLSCASQESVRIVEKDIPAEGTGVTYWTIISCNLEM